MKSWFRRKTKAFGLLEVVVAIAISGITMIGLVSVSLNALRSIQRNELIDTGSGVMIRSLEIAKSPAEFSINELLSGASAASFVLDLDTSTNEFNLVPVGDPSSEIRTCQPGSEFQVTDQLQVQIGNLCNQVIISRQSALGDFVQTYEVKSIIAVAFDGDVYQDEIVSYASQRT